MELSPRAGLSATLDRASPPGPSGFPHRVELLGLTQDREREATLWAQREFGGDASVVDAFIRLTMSYTMTLTIAPGQSRSSGDGVITRFSFKDANQALAFKMYWG